MFCSVFGSAFLDQFLLLSSLLLRKQRNALAKDKRVLSTYLVVISTYCSVLEKKKIQKIKEMYLLPFHIGYDPAEIVL